MLGLYKGFVFKGVGVREMKTVARLMILAGCIATTSIHSMAQNAPIGIAFVQAPEQGGTMGARGWVRVPEQGSAQVVTRVGAGA